MTTNPKVRAGQPYMPVLHRVDSSQLGQDDGVTVTPIQFAGDEPTNSTLEAEYGEYTPIDWASFRPLLAAVAVICLALLVGWRLS